MDLEHTCCTCMMFQNHVYDGSSIPMAANPIVHYMTLAKCVICGLCLSLCSMTIHSVRDGWANHSTSMQYIVGPTLHLQKESWEQLASWYIFFYPLLNAISTNNIQMKNCSYNLVEEFLEYLKRICWGGDIWVCLNSPELGLVESLESDEIGEFRARELVQPSRPCIHPVEGSRTPHKGHLWKKNNNKMLLIIDQS